MNAWIQITSGRGPEECALAVAELMAVFDKEARALGFGVDLLEAIHGERGHTLKSALLTVSGEPEALRAYLSGWEGTAQWIMKSPYRPNHGRKNWFVGVNVFYPPEADSEISIQDIRYEALRASGPGGQHVNKTSSAIRATHLPSGLVACAQEERSQSMNKKLATARLLAALKNRAQKTLEAFEQDVWHRHNTLERGNPTRTYKGKPLRLVKNNN